MKKPIIMAHNAFHGLAGPRGGSAKLTSGAGPAMLLVIVSTPHLGFLRWNSAFRTRRHRRCRVCRLQPRCQSETIDRGVPGAMAVARTTGETGRA
jgi:hypothetical protein